MGISKFGVRGKQILKMHIVVHIIVGNFRLSEGKTYWNNAYCSTYCGGNNFTKLLLEIDSRFLKTKEKI
jgi:hypothetical protein